MGKGIIMVDIPKSCKNIHGYKNGCTFGGMVCQIKHEDVMKHVENGTKPSWCPIKPFYSSGDHNTSLMDDETVMLSPKELICLLKKAPHNDIVMVEINDGKGESGVIEDVMIGGGTTKGFTFIKVSTDI